LVAGLGVDGALRASPIAAIIQIGRLRRPDHGHSLTAPHNADAEVSDPAVLYDPVALAGPSLAQHARVLDGLCRWRREAFCGVLRALRQDAMRGWVLWGSP